MFLKEVANPSRQLLIEMGFRLDASIVMPVCVVRGLDRLEKRFVQNCMFKTFS